MQVTSIPILQDNFVFVIHDHKNAAVVDPGDARPVIEWLKANNLTCQKILITHHHHDHVDGVQEIKNTFNCEVYGPLYEKETLPKNINSYVTDTDHVLFQDLEFFILHLPGHTLGHIAYYQPQQKWLFSGDVLFALGCGRLFEGTSAQMFNSLQKIKTLPDETQIFCTHDYLKKNKEFCLSQNLNLLNYQNNLPPLKLSAEKKFNPFLTSQTVEEFTRFREARNKF